MNTQKLAIFGLFAFIAFVLSFLVFASMTPGYSHTVNAISELGMAGSPYARLWNFIGFGFVGFLVLPFAYSLLVSLRPNPSASTISILVAISGLGWMSLGLFTAAPGFQQSLPTTLHFMVSRVSYFSFLLAAFVFTIKLTRVPYWHSWVLFSLIMSLLGLASFFIPPAILPGALSQRLALVVYFLWLFGMGWAVVRKPLPAYQQNFQAT